MIEAYYMVAWKDIIDILAYTLKKYEVHIDLVQRIKNIKHTFTSLLVSYARSFVKKEDWRAVAFLLAMYHWHYQGYFRRRLFEQGRNPVVDFKPANNLH